MKFLFLCFIFLLPLSSAFGYSQFIGHSYTSCLNCHFNPSGGGPLNDYGRVVGATAISSGALYPKSWTEEKVAYTSGFLFRKPKQNWLRTQINYRGFKLVQNPGSSSSEETRWINMQMDGRVILKFGENDKFISVFNYGYAPLPPGSEKQSEWRSREHYLGYRINPKVGFYVGSMDKVFGIKIVEHIAYSRTVPQVAQNDQVHGVLGHVMTDNWEFFGHGFLGNLSQDEDLRMKGTSLMAERTVFQNHRLGASVMKSQNNYQDLFSYSGHARLNLKEGSAILGELGQTSRTTKSGTGEVTQRFGLLQTYLRPVRGLYFLSNIEYWMKNTEEEDYSVRWGPGIQYFPVQKVELRFDAYNTRSFSPDSSTKDKWMYLLQTHLWL